MLVTEWKLEDALEVRGEEEIERINKLNTLLMEENRFEDLKRSTVDREYQKKLLEEFDI